MLQRGDDLCGMRQDYFRLKSHQFFCQRLCPNADGRKANVDVEISALRPTEPIELLPKSCETHLGFRVVLGETHQHCDVPNARLLRPRRQRPRRRNPADERDEVAAPQCWTSPSRVGLSHAQPATQRPTSPMNGPELF